MPSCIRGDRPYSKVAFIESPLVGRAFLARLCLVSPRPAVLVCLGWLRFVGPSGGVVQARRTRGDLAGLNLCLGVDVLSNTLLALPLQYYVRIDLELCSILIIACRLAPARLAKVLKCTSASLGTLAAPTRFSVVPCGGRKLSLRGWRA